MKTRISTDIARGDATAAGSEMVRVDHEDEKNPLGFFDWADPPVRGIDWRRTRQDSSTANVEEPLSLLPSRL